MGKNRIGIILLLLLLTVGFATVTANLIINNNANISARPDDFSVIFTSAIAEDGGTAEISNDKKVITYSTKELKQIGDIAELDYRVTNDSHQYDANVLIDIAFDNPSYSQYFDIQYETFNNSTSELLEAQTTKEGKIIIKLIEPVLEDANVLFTITLDVDAVERNNVAAETYYTLIFDTQGGNTIDSKNIQSYHEYGSLPTPTRNGFTFTGWYKGDELVDEHTTIESSTETVEAHWSRNSYNLTIDLDGGSSSQGLSHTILYEETLNLTVPTKQYFKLTGWTVTGSGSSVTNNVFKMGYENTTIKANYTRQTYSVKFNGNGSTSGSMSNQTIGIGVATALTANAFSRTGYQFLGWSTSNTATAPTYKDKQSVTNLSTTDGGTVNLYAVWMKSDYSYTGGVQTFIAPVAGTYKLETWGAQGGGKQPGYGGYAVGNVSLTKGKNIYVVVGGAGAVSTNGNNGGGYNGGGQGTNQNQPGSGGGGATHIATANRGVLSNYKSYVSELLIVSGGGGGSLTTNNTSHGYGGSGGGYTGVTGGYYHNLNWSFYGTGGTQSAGGVCYLYGSDLSDTGSRGSFGLGGNHGYENGNNVGGSGGGGGYYGGGGASRSHAQAGGGSGYIGNSSLLSNNGITKHMTCYSCSTSTAAATRTQSTSNKSSTATADYAKQGSGYARITFIG